MEKSRKQVHQVIFVSLTSKVPITGISVDHFWSFNESVSIEEKQNTKISHNFYNRKKFGSNDDDHADDDVDDDDDADDVNDANDADDTDDKTALKRKPKVDENRCWRRIVKMQNYFVVVFSIFDEFGQKKKIQSSNFMPSWLHSNERYPRKKAD